MGMMRTLVKQAAFAAAVIVAKRVINRVSGRSRRKQLAHY